MRKSNPEKRLKDTEPVFPFGGTSFDIMPSRSLPFRLIRIVWRKDGRQTNEVSSFIAICRKTFKAS